MGFSVYYYDMWLNLFLLVFFVILKWYIFKEFFNCVKNDVFINSKKRYIIRKKLDWK